MDDFYKKYDKITMKMRRKFYKSCTVTLKPKSSRFRASTDLRQPAFFSERRKYVLRYMSYQRNEKKPF